METVIIIPLWAELNRLRLCRNPEPRCSLNIGRYYTFEIKPHKTRAAYFYNLKCIIIIIEAILSLKMEITEGLVRRGFQVFSCFRFGDLIYSEDLPANLGPNSKKQIAFLF